MTDPHEVHATDIDLSAYHDAELPAPSRLRIAAHIAACPLCTKRLADFAALSADFAQLPKESLGFDLASVIAGQLPAPARSYRQTAGPGWLGLLPAGIGATVSIALGIAMGGVLFGGGAALPRETSAMSVFDSIPPGGLCLGLDSCYAEYSTKTGVIK